MNRFELSNQLTERLGRDYVVVASPDHPELVSGPDVLVGGRGRLTALFRVARSTPRRLLEARIVATRLALPAGSTLTAIVERDAEPPHHLVHNGFDVALGDRAIRDIVRVCTEGGRDGRLLQDLRTVQQKHAMFYSTVLQIAELRQRYQLKAGSARDIVADLRSREPLLDEQAMKSSPSEIRPKMPRRPAKAEFLRATVGQTTVASLPGRQSRSITSRLRPLWSEALADDFVLDAGVPYQKAFQPRVLLVESWPRNRFDPRKPARAAAFASWLMAIATTPDEIERLADRSLEITAKRIHA